MSFCLVFLTGVNFVLYPPDCQDAMACVADDTTVPFPVEEERSETSTSTSIVEEYLHNSHDLELSWFEKMSMLKIHDAQQLQIVHFELWSPPPELS
ncbi:MAG: hypothetical protein K0Q66_847 [Chitinophagaceae bacterium]|jgi:hypothetical protein|nr:hypothetical protein [Chitinophagaceae bacterium]